MSTEELAAIGWQLKADTSLSVPEATARHSLSNGTRRNKTDKDVH